jgi:hypothetical protein
MRPGGALRDQRAGQETHCAFLTASPSGEKTTACKEEARKQVQTARLKKVASLHCGLAMSKGNNRANGISERESRQNQR